jgi:hypothetical protein
MCEFRTHCDLSGQGLTVLCQALPSCSLLGGHDKCLCWSYMLELHARPSQPEACAPSNYEPMIRDLLTTAHKGTILVGPQERCDAKGTR